MVGTVFLLLFFSETWIEIPAWGSRWKWRHLLFLNSASSLLKLQIFLVLK